MSQAVSPDMCQSLEGNFAPKFEHILCTMKIMAVQMLARPYIQQERMISQPLDVQR